MSLSTELALTETKPRSIDRHIVIRFIFTWLILCLLQLIQNKKVCLKRTKWKDFYNTCTAIDMQ